MYSRTEIIKYRLLPKAVYGQARLRDMVVMLTSHLFASRIRPFDRFCGWLPNRERIHEFFL